VFIAPTGDHYVTRLTHTLEVSQIARTIARALNLNEDLTEAISLGHDLGHTPFGHVGESILNELFPGGFHHNEQSLRVVDCLEKNGHGLNLTWEVRDGILNHSKTGLSKLYGEDWGTVGTLEGEVCKIADLVAYINHDIGDAIRAGMLSERDLPKEALDVLGYSHSERIDTMVCDIIMFSWGVTGKSGGPVQIGMSERVKKAANLLRDYLFENVYSIETRSRMSQEARETLVFLYEYFLKHPEEIPGDVLKCSDTLERGVTDYIAGMTDQYALNLAQKLNC